MVEDFDAPLRRRPRAAGITPHEHLFSPLYDYENLGKNIYTKRAKSILVERKENSQEINIDPEFKKNKIYRDKNFIDGEILSAGTGQKIVDILASKKMKEPWFNFILLMDLHRSVNFPLPENFKNEKFGTNDYEKMVSSIDYWIGKILEKIDLTKTLIVITSDHGDFIPISSIDHEISYIPSLVKLGQKIKNMTQWIAFVISRELPFGIPKSIDAVYKDKGWINTQQFFHNTYVNYDGFKIYLQKSKVKSKLDFVELRDKNKLSDHIPKYPELYYYDSWKNWGTCIKSMNQRKRRKYHNG